MAPRRGGGGGGGGSVENQCSRNGAFQSEYDIAQIALLGAFLLFFTVLWCVACSTTGKKKQAGTFRILRWYQWGIAIFLAFLYVLKLGKWIYISFATNSFFPGGSRSQSSDMSFQNATSSLPMALNIPVSESLRLLPWPSANSG